MFTDHPFLAVSDLLPPRRADGDRGRRRHARRRLPQAQWRIFRSRPAAQARRGTVAPHSLSPLQGLQRLEKIIDEYVGGVSMFYVTSAPRLEHALELIAMLKEDPEHTGADSLHQIQRAWELHHRVWTAESVARHTLSREETRWPGYTYRADHPRLVDEDRHVFTSSRYDPQRRAWQMEKLPVHHIVS